MRRIGPAARATCTFLLLSGSIRAEPSAAKAAAAETLFEQGTALMREGDYANACQKFQGSLELDAALGTMLRLADCYDRAGKTASAWSTFRDAAALARSNGEVEREQIAEQRAADAETRLPKLKLVFGDPVIPKDLTIRLNGEPLPRAAWEVPLPVDPGLQKLDASAEARRSWSTSIDVPRGATTREVVVPALPPLPKEPPLTPTVAPAAEAARAPTSAGPFYQDLLGDTLLAAGVAAGAVGGYFLVKGNDGMRSADHATRYGEYDSLATRAEHEQLAGVITLGGGGLLLACSLVRYFTRGAPSRDERSTLLLGPAGAAYRGRF